MQYLSGVPQYSSHLKWILVFLEVWAGVLWIDTIGVCSACIQETLQLLPEGVSLKFASYNVYSFIRLPTLAMNSRTGSNSGCISSAVVT